MQKQPIDLTMYSKYFEGYVSFLYCPQSAMPVNLSLRIFQQHKLTKYNYNVKIRNLTGCICYWKMPSQENTLQMGHLLNHLSNERHCLWHLDKWRRWIFKPLVMHSVPQNHQMCLSEGNLQSRIKSTHVSYSIPPIYKMQPSVLI